MHLIIFDIDGTLIQSYVREGDYFEAALNKATGITNIERELQAYRHVSDLGIAMECIETFQQRSATPHELQTIENHFLDLFNHALKQEPVIAIAGVQDFFNYLYYHPDYAVAIATGSYFASAKLKLQSAELLTTLPIASSSDSFDRRLILDSALNKAKAFYQVSHFNSIVYFGDGPWDIATVKQLQWGFIGVASNYSKEQLQAWGAPLVLPDYLSLNDAKYFLALARRFPLG